MSCLKDENVEWHKWLEKRVCVKDKFVGTLKYFGSTKFSDGLWCGIELDEPVGKNNGTVNKIKYFSCLPKFGIFVPVNKVCRIENALNNLNSTCVRFNGTFEVQNCREKTVILSNSNALNESNKENEEMCEAKKNGTLDSRQDSEESLGILDPSLIDSFTSSSELINLNSAGDMIPDFKDSIFNLGKKELILAEPFLPAEDDIFSSEISNPKYASTPRHPVKKRPIYFGSDDIVNLPLQNINENVFDDQLGSTQDVFFDYEKLRNNSMLTSTCEVQQLINTSSGKNINSCSPIQHNPSPQSVDLNKTKVFPSSILTNQGIVSVDLNRTQTLQNEGKPSIPVTDILSTTFKMPSTEAEDTNVTINVQTGKKSEIEVNIVSADYPKTKDLNSTVTLQSEERSGNPQQSCQIVAMISETDNLESSDLNSTVSLDFKRGSESSEKFGREEIEANILSETCCHETNDLNSTVSLQSNGKIENCEKSSLIGTLADLKWCENVNLNATCDFNLKLGNAAIEDFQVDVNAKPKSDFDRHESTSICLSNTFSSNSFSPLIVDGVESKPLFDKTFVLDQSLSKQTQNSEQAASVNVSKSNVNQLESFGNKKKFLEETTILENSLSDTSARHSLCLPAKSRNLNCAKRLSISYDFNSSFQKKSRKSSISKNLKDLKNSPSMPLKASNVNKKDFEFKKPLSTASSICKPKTSLKKVASTNSKKDLQLKNNTVAHSKQSIATKINPKSSNSSVMKFEQHENKNCNGNENKNILPAKTLPCNINSKICVNTDAKKGRLSSSTGFDKRLNGIPTAKSNSFSQNGVSNRLTNSSGSLRFGTKDSGNLNQTRNVSPKTLATNDVNVASTSKASLNIMKSSAFDEKTFNNGVAENLLTPESKEPVTKLKKPISRQSLGLSSIGCRIPRRNSLSANLNSNLPISAIKPRYSMLPSIQERNSGVAQNAVHAVEMPVKCNGNLVPDAVPRSSCTKTLSGKNTKIVSSLPQKSQIATRKMALKYSDAKEERCASPKVPRYNLRGKK